jgi:LemA protein
MNYLLHLVRVFVLLLMPFALAACGINSVPTKEEKAKASWGDVQSQYQRRADLVPNLVATVQGYAKQERSVLVDVTNARARATSVQISSAQLRDPAAIQQFDQAQGGLSQSLGRLLLVVERYPDLKSNQNFLALQSQLEGTENGIAIARRDYNDAVRDYNTEIRTFPSIVAARIIYSAKPLQPFQTITPKAELAPAVKF